jgi:hypothetical protein
MSRVACSFRDPRTGTVYAWPVNHTTEEQFGKQRNVEHTAPTSGVGLVRQQGDDQPLILQLTGTILHRTQEAAFVEWFELSRLQSIYWTDWTGAEYEVIITGYQPRRERVLLNPRDRGMDYVVRWTMTLEVLAVRAGPWQGVTP